jgi:hypothetical protein
MVNISTAADYLQLLRSNLEEWRAGEIDHPTFTESQQQIWTEIRKHGSEMEEVIVAAIGLLEPDDRKILARRTKARPA